MKYVRIACLIVVLAISPVGPAAAIDCNVDLKPSDGYKELSAKLRCLNDRIKALEGGSSNEVLIPNAASQTKKSGSMAGLDWSGFKITASPCKATGSIAKCVLNITSADDARLVIFLPDSAIFDGAGKKGALTAISLGKRLDLADRVYTDCCWKNAQLELIGGVQSPVELEFELADASANVVSAMKLNMLRVLDKRPDKWASEIQTLRNIPISR